MARSQRLRQEIAGKLKLLLSKGDMTPGMVLSKLACNWRTARKALDMINGFTYRRGLDYYWSIKVGSQNTIVTQLRSLIADEPMRKKDILKKIGCKSWELDRAARVLGVNRYLKGRVSYWSYEA